MNPGGRATQEIRTNWKQQKQVINVHAVAVFSDGAQPFQGENAL